jgi:hypothetical protein
VQERGAQLNAGRRLQQQVAARPPREEPHERVTQKGAERARIFLVLVFELGHAQDAGCQRDDDVICARRAGGKRRCYM